MNAKAVLSAGLIAALPFILSAHAAEDPHHPAGETAPTVAAPPPASAIPRQPGMADGPHGMMNMMGTHGQGPMAMMGMMQMMGGSNETPGMGMIDRVEGRIAFLRTELKISAAQGEVWNGFAAALRRNAQSLGAARTAMMAQMSGQPRAVAQRIEAQERWLAARLEGTRLLRTAFTGLYAALTDEQKRTADDLLGPHMGLMPMMPMTSMGPGAQ